MRFGHAASPLDEIDLSLLARLQRDCRTPLARLGESVGLSAPSVMERIKKLEAAGVIMGYHALLDARRIGLDVTAFIGVIASRPEHIEPCEEQIGGLDGVLECHHVTGEYTLLVKAKTATTSTLETLIRQIRALPGIERTETIVVLSTYTERPQALLAVDEPGATPPRSRARRNGRTPQ